MSYDLRLILAAHNVFLTILSSINNIKIKIHIFYSHENTAPGFEPLFMLTASSSSIHIMDVKNAIMLILLFAGLRIRIIVNQNTSAIRFTIIMIYK